MESCTLLVGMPGTFLLLLLLPFLCPVVSVVIDTGVFVVLAVGIFCRSI